MANVVRTTGSVLDGNCISPNDLLKESLGIIVHDLSTPLSVLAFLVSTLAKEDSPPPGVHRALKALEMAQQIIATAKSIYLNDGFLDLDSNIDIVQLAHETVKHVENLAMEKQIQIEVANHLGENPIRIFGQYEIIKNQILVNILTNAIKFSNVQSKILLRLTASANKVNLEIIDHGVGIPSKFLRELNSNSKGKTTRGTLGERGAGIGLHIVKTFSELLNVQFSLQSSFQEENKQSGTSVCLTFQRF